MVLENKAHRSQKPEELYVLAMWKSINKDAVLYREEHLLVHSGSKTQMSQHRQGN